MFKKILMKIYTSIKINIVIFKTKRLKLKRIGINKKNIRKRKIIVSLTSYSKRFSTLPLCIKSLLTQTLKPDKIILYLTNKDYLNVTKEIKKLQQYGLEIKIVDLDLRPHKKYYYAMREYHNDIIITVDDDVIYDKQLVEQLMLTHRRYPDAIVTARARLIKADNAYFFPYNEWKLVTTSYEPSMKLLATGVGGVLYPPYLLNEGLLFNLDYINNYINVDDLWLKTVEIISGIPTVICDLSVDHHRIEIPSAQKNGLTNINVFQKQNDKYWLELNRQFKLFEKLFNR